MCSLMSFIYADFFSMPMESQCTFSKNRRGIHNNVLFTVLNFSQIKMHFVAIKDNSKYSVLKDELLGHRQILRYFRKLPLVLRKIVQEYHISRMPMLLCPECGSGYYQIFMPILKATVQNCFMCEHNYYMLRFCNRASLAEREPLLLEF